MTIETPNAFFMFEGRQTPLFKKNGLVTAKALDEQYVNRKVLKKGFAEMSKNGETYLVRGFNPAFFSQDFCLISDAETYFRKLR